MGATREMAAKKGVTKAVELTRLMPRILFLLESVCSGAGENRGFIGLVKVAKNKFLGKCIQIAFPRVVLASAQSADTNDYFEEFFP